MVIFNSYVSLPEGISTNMLVVCVLTSGIPECEWENDDKPGDVYNSPRSYRQLEVLSIAVKTKKTDVGCDVSRYSDGPPQYPIWLVVWNMAFMTFHSVGNFINPTDEIHDFSE